LAEETKIKITAETADFERAQKEVQREINVTTKLLEELNRVSREGGIEYQMHARELIKELKTQYLTLKDISDSLNKQIREYEKLGKEGKKNVGEVKEAVDKLKESLNRTTETMRQVEVAVGETGRKTQSTIRSVMGALGITGLPGRVVGVVAGAVGVGALFSAIAEGIQLAIRQETAFTMLRRAGGYWAIPTPITWEQIAQRAGVSRVEAYEIMARIAPMLGGGVGAETWRRMMILLGARGITPEVWGGFFQRLIGMGGAALAGEEGDRRRAQLIGEVFATAFMTRADRRLPMFLQAIEGAISKPLSQYIARVDEVQSVVVGTLRMTGGLWRILQGQYSSEQIARVVGVIQQTLVSPTSPFMEALTYRLIAEAIRGGMPPPDVIGWTGRGTYWEVEYVRRLLPGILGGRERPPEWALGVVGGMFAPFIRMARAGQLLPAAGILAGMLPGVDPRFMADLLTRIVRETRGRDVSPQELGRLIMGEMKGYKPPRTVEDLLSEIDRNTSEYLKTMADIKNLLVEVGYIALPVFTMLKTLMPQAIALLFHLTRKVLPSEIETEMVREWARFPEFAPIARRILGTEYFEAVRRLEQARELPQVPVERAPELVTMLQEQLGYRLPATEQEAQRVYRRLEQLFKEPVETAAMTGTIVELPGGLRMMVMGWHQNRIDVAFTFGGKVVRFGAQTPERRRGKK
jgi:hypothetical protein